MAFTKRNSKVSGMNKEKAKAIVTRLLTNAAELQYGAVSVTVKVHCGRVTDVTYTTTESMRDNGIADSDTGETATGQ